MSNDDRDPSSEPSLINRRRLVQGMAAALPYCDAFVSGHNYAALVEVAAAIRGDPSASARPSVTIQQRTP